MKERLMVADGATPPGIPVVEEPPETRELRRAIENSELYWRKCEPLNDLRLRSGLPIVTKAELMAKKALIQAPYLKKHT